MIQVYSPSNTTYTRNGDLILHPIECRGDFTLNGTWSVEMRTPLDGSQAYLEPDAVIKAKGPQGTDQLYRIYQVEKDLKGVTSYATPIFLQAAHDVFFMDRRAVNMTGQQALDHLMEGTDYSGSSDITDTNSAYYVRKNLIECLLSNEATSFLNRWGGEVYYDNRTIYINKRIGQDNGVRAKFGLNMTGCQAAVDYSTVVTRIVPIAYNGYLLPEPCYVDSPRIANYPFVRTKLMEFPNIKLAQDAISTDITSEVYDTLEELQEALQAAAEAEFAKGIDLPTVTYDVSIADLSRVVGYEDVADFYVLHLGDTVHVTNTTLGIETSARVVEMVWDFILERTVEFRLGDYRGNYFSRLTQTQYTLSKVLNTADQTVNAEAVAGVLNAMQAQLRLQNTAAQRSDVRAILFEDLDPDSPLYGAMSIGTQGFQIANARTADGQDWDWRTFGTAAGFSADLIIAGILYSQNYLEGVQGIKIDLNTGTIEAPALSATIRSEAAEDTQAQITATADRIQTSVSALDNQINGQSGIEAQLGAVNDQIDSLSTILGTTQSEVSNAFTSITQTNSRIDLLAGDLAGFTAYMHFDANNYLIIGDTGSPFNTQMTNSAFNVLYNGEPVVSVNATGMDAQQIRLSGGEAAIDMPPIKIVPYTNGWTLVKSGG